MNINKGGRKMGKTTCCLLATFILIIMSVGCESLDTNINTVTKRQSTIPIQVCNSPGQNMGHISLHVSWLDYQNQQMYAWMTDDGVQRNGHFTIAMRSGLSSTVPDDRARWNMYCVDKKLWQPSAGNLWHVARLCNKHYSNYCLSVDASDNHLRSKYFANPSQDADIFWIQGNAFDYLYRLRSWPSVTPDNMIYIRMDYLNNWFFHGNNSYWHLNRHSSLSTENMTKAFQLHYNE